jgi:hypothetical protein
MAQATYDQLEERADVVVRFADQNPGHARRIAVPRRDCETGMV